METIPWRYRDMEKRVAGGPLPAWLVYGVCLAAVVNFTAFFFHCWYLGGDALSGHQAAGHYYISWKGTLTEVSRDTFQYSLWHARSVFVTHPLAMAVALIALGRQKRPGQI